MTLNVNWNALMQSPDIGAAFNQGMEQGRARRREQAIDEAYRGLIANPNDPTVVNELARYDPQAAYQVQGRQQQSQQAAAEADARRGAVAGDQQALQALAGFNFDDYLKLDKRAQEQTKQGIEVIGNLALMADTPEEWDDTVQQLAQADPTFNKYIGRFDLRQSVIAQAGQAKEFIAQNEPRYQVIPEGGMLVNTRDPAALAQVGAGGAPAAPQGGISEDQAAPIIQNAMQSKIISPEDFARIQQSLGPNGQQAAQQWLQSQGIQIGKQIGGKTYVQRGGDWYEVN